MPGQFRIFSLLVQVRAWREIVGSNERSEPYARARQVERCMYRLKSRCADRRSRSKSDAVACGGAPIVEFVRYGQWARGAPAAGLSCYADVPALDEESCISLSEGEVKSQELAPRD